MNARAIPSPRTASGRFEAELEHFRKQAEGAVQFLAAYLAVGNAVARDQAIHSAVNESPLYWLTSQAALQKSLFLALGRIFDQKSEHNIDKLIGMAQDCPAIFSREKLGQRKQGNAAQPPDWLAEYLRAAYEPSTIDFREMRKAVGQYRKTYERVCRPLRNAHFAHSETIEPAEIEALFAQTNIGELQDLLDFLCSLHAALWELYFNGTKPNLSPPKPGDPPSRMRSLSERVRQQTEALLQKLLDRPASVLGGHAPSRLD
jgi:hypothetical protein